MTFHAMTEHYEEITVCGKPTLFTSIRIRRDTVPDGLYAYDVRHDDECRGIPCEIAPFVMVNHWGTILKRAVGHTPKSKTLDEVYLHPKANQMIEAFDPANQLVKDEVLA